MPEEGVRVLTLEGETLELTRPSVSRYRMVVAPRLLLPVYWLMKALLLPAFLWGRAIRSESETAPPRLTIQAGVKGWESIFYQELLRSAQEFIGSARVATDVIDRSQPYAPQARATIGRSRPTHFLFDPRTTSDRTIAALAQTFVLSWVLLVRGVTPIVFLTDASCRSWRMQSAVVTSWRGVVLTCMSARQISKIFPHRRLVGPVLMPLSAATLDQLHRIREESPRRDIPVIRFVGLAYSPRIEWLTQLQHILAQRRIPLEIHTSKAQTSNEDYWKLLSETDILVTTTMQVRQPQYDWSWEPQVLFRYTEALAVGTALVATSVPGLERHLQGGLHYAVYESLEDCANVVEGLLASRVERELLANRGHRKLISLVESRSFWSQVDASLGRDSMK